jgi:hypothetical protein
LNDNPDAMNHYKPPENYERLSGVGVSDRSEVARLAKGSPSQALVIARSIQHPWYRCQALAYIVEANPSHANAEVILDEALMAAYSQPEPNRVASVAMWPLTQLIQVNLLSARKHTGKLLEVISNEPHGLRRLGGLYAILWAVASVQKLRNAALQPFLETAKVSFGWRSERIIDCAILAIAPYDRDSSVLLLNSRPATRFNKRSRALLGVTPDSVEQLRPVRSNAE